MPGRLPVCATVARDGKPVMLLPLMMYRERGLRIVRFASEGVTDYNAPLVVGVSPADSPALMKALRAALAGYDVLHLSNMMPFPTRCNPLTAALPTIPSGAAGHSIEPGDDWSLWFASLKRSWRHQFERTWRVFCREPDARFERISDAEEARRIFRILESQQSDRMQEIGEEYSLDDLRFHDLYEHRLSSGLADGSVVLTALLSGADVVAALYTIGLRDRFVFLRIAHGGDRWKHCSPGMLLLERTIHHLHALGGRHFDFGSGEHPYKRAFNVRREPLLDSCIALSLRGIPYLACWKVWRFIKDRMIPAATKLYRTGVRFACQ